MKSGICPKCGSKDVYAGSTLPPRGKAGPHEVNSIPITAGVLPSVVALDNYVCVNCGYVESYISDPAKLHKIAEHWPRVEDLLREEKEQQKITPSQLNDF
ncbi:MAG: hypothetical protein K8I82_29275 [Anaerolineae bacterium]|nr:hypothetical protein [Anaerolineae bacterium]